MTGVQTCALPIFTRDAGTGEDLFNGEFLVNLGWAPADDATWPVPTYTSGNPMQTRYSHAGFPTDTAWDLLVDRSGETERLVLFAIGSPAIVESGTQRVDNDRYIVRLELDGSIDPTFNGGEVFTFHSEGVLGDNTRRGLVEADGSIVSSGYTNFGTGLGNHVVMIRLLPDGTPDTNFGFGFASARPGVARFNPFVVDGGAAEAYGVARLSNGTYVTTGYGGATAITNASTLGYAMTVLQDVVSFGFTATGLSAGFGDSGRFVQQSEAQVPAVANTEDRGRHIAVLPDDRTLQVGRFGGVTAIFVVLPDGTLDESVGDGGRFLYQSIPSQFFGVAVSADGTRIVATTDAHANGAGVAILQVGAPADIYETPATRFVADFIGNVNLMDGTLAEDEADHCVIDCQDLKHYVGHGITGTSGMAVSVAVRPEKIHLSRHAPADEDAPQSFNRAKGDVYQLSLTLKSSASTELATPAIELTLTDVQDQPILRRVLQPSDLPVVGRVLRARTETATLLAAGPSSVLQAWASDVPAGEDPIAPADGPVFVLAGSLSPVTARQVEAATSYEKFWIDPAQLIAAGGRYLQDSAAAIAGRLHQGRSVLACTVTPGRVQQTDLPARELALAGGRLLARVLTLAPLRRVGVAGGDTSSLGVQALNAWGLSYEGALAAGCALCRLHSDVPALDGVQHGGG